MMKKRVYVFSLICLTCVFALSCASEDQSFLDSLKSEVQSQQTDETIYDEKDSSIKAAAKDSRADVDLTVLSSTMVYAEVNNIMVNPDEYMGKTIKMSGPYYTSFYDETGLYYHYVIIEDATACCAQGLEFIWEGEHVFPDDYPEEESIIEVIGVFGSYDELGLTYYYLSVDEIVVL